MMNKFWEMIVETNFASGHAHNHVEGANWGMLEIIDDNGTHAIWSYDKKNQKITLKGA